MSVRTAIVGATGALGQEILAALAEVARDGELELEPPVLLATSRTAGEAFPWLDEDEDLALEPFAAEAVRGLAYALVAVPAAAAGSIVKTLRLQGLAVIDASRAHRGEAPLFFDVRPPVLVGQQLVSLPSPEALLVARVLHALADLEPSWVRATILRPASAAGQAGVTELGEGTGRLLNGQEPETQTLPHRLAFNLVPQAGPFDGADTEAETDLAREVALLVGRPVRIASTVGFAPWFYGHFATLSVGLCRPASAEAVRERLEHATRVKVLDNPAEGIYPMPSLATGDDAVLVGRVRADPVEPGAVQLVAAMDGLRATAALAVEALQALVRSREAH